MKSNNKQLPLRLFGLVGQIKDLPYEEVRLCNNPYQAVRLCIKHKNHEWLAESLDMKQGTFTNMVNRDILERNAKKEGKKFRARNMDLGLINQIQALCGNRAISQYLDLESKGQLRCQQDELFEAQREACSA